MALCACMQTFPPSIVQPTEGREKGIIKEVEDKTGADWHTQKNVSHLYDLCNVCLIKSSLLRKKAHLNFPLFMLLNNHNKKENIKKEKSKQKDVGVEWKCL